MSCGRIYWQKEPLRMVRGQKKRRVCAMREHSFIQSMRMGSVWKGSGAMLGAMATDAGAVAYRWGVSSLGLEDGCKDTSSCPQMHLMHIACICRISLPYKLFYDIFVIVTWKGFTGLITFIGLGFGVNSFLFVDSRDQFFFHIVSQSNLVGHLSGGNAKADTD